jgi:hypothetical protein
VSAAVQIILAELYCALRAGASTVAPVDVIVTPAPSARVTWPAPNCAMFTMSLALKIEGGTVKVIAEALLRVTHLVLIIKD